jgi:hypothetical protein
MGKSLQKRMKKTLSYLLFFFLVRKREFCQHRWVAAIILATGGGWAEIGRITVQSQPRQIVGEILSQKY